MDKAKESIKEMIAKNKQELTKVSAVDRTAELNERVAAFREEVLAEFAKEKSDKTASITLEIEVLERVLEKLETDAQADAQTNATPVQ